MSHWQKWQCHTKLLGPAGELCADHPFVVNGAKTRVVNVVCVLIPLWPVPLRMRRKVLQPPRPHLQLSDGHQAWLVRYPMPLGHPLGITTCMLCLTHMRWWDSQTDGYDGLMSISPPLPPLGLIRALRNWGGVRTIYAFSPFSLPSASFPSAHRFQLKEIVTDLWPMRFPAWFFWKNCYFSTAEQGKQQHVHPCQAAAGYIN